MNDTIIHGLPPTQTSIWLLSVTVATQHTPIRSSQDVPRGEPIPDGSQTFTVIRGKIIVRAYIPLKRVLKVLPRTGGEHLGIPDPCG